MVADLNVARRTDFIPGGGGEPSPGKRLFRLVVIVDIDVAPSSPSSSLLLLLLRRFVHRSSARWRCRLSASTPPLGCAHSFSAGPHLFDDASVGAGSRNRCRRPRHDAITGVRASQIGCPPFDWNGRPYNPIRSCAVDSEVVGSNSQTS
jgi:hypothetical protein